MGAPTVLTQDRGAATSANGTQPDSEGVGERIGPYTLVGVIGEGGFGVVYAADQTGPLRRRVALKVIRLGMDTRQVIARFEQERQALALMDHPSIAKVLDAGATDRGRPYFVMEFIEGVPITQYCDTARLPPRERLELFIQVCHAVQHAHQKGIIHRDLKPSNVLVTMQDGRPVPKVIDFGVAKATAHSLTERTAFTEQRQFIGTPEYMSPEQADLTALDVDTRTDVYALGVLLYELLTGVTPFDPTHLRSAAFAEMQRIIREVDPPKPSTRLSTLDTLANVAACRQTEPRRLNLLIRGDLDWIVMRCLEKDRARRYETANGLADDIQRYLSGEPVQAAPPSRAYRLRKFTRRNKRPVTAAALVLLVLTLGTVGTTAGFISAQRRATSEATARLETQQVADFQARMLADIDPTVAGVMLMRDIRDRFDAATARKEMPDTERSAQAETFQSLLRVVNGTDTAVAMIDRTILKPAVGAIDKQFQDQPLVDASLRQTLADLYVKLGLLKEAEPLQERTLSTRRRLLGDDHPSTIESMINSGALLLDSGKLPEAERVTKEALQTSKRVLGDDHPQTITALENMGALLRALGDMPTAEQYLREALEKARRILGPDNPGTFSSAANLGAIIHLRGKLSEVEPYYREALEGRRRILGDDHPDTIESIANLGQLLLDQVNYAEAEPLLLQALEQARRVLGEEHPDTISFTMSVAGLLRSESKLPQAERYYREVMEKRRRLLGDDHALTIAAIGAVATVLQDLGRYPEAEPYAREALERSQRTMGPDAPETANALNNLGILLWYRGKPAEALPYVQEGLDKSRRALGEQHPQTLSAICNMGTVLSDLGRYPEAEAYYVESLDKRRRFLGDDHPDTLISVCNVGYILQVQGKNKEAEPYMREALEKRRRVLGDDHHDTLTSIHNLAFVLYAQGKVDEAEPLAKEELERKRRTLGEEHPDTLGAITFMGSVRKAQGNFPEAEKYAQEALEKCRALLGEKNAHTVDAANGLGAIFEAQKKFDLAEPLYREVLEKRRQALPPDHPFILASMHNLGRLLLALKKLDESEELLLSAATAAEKVLPPTHEGRKKMCQALVKLYKARETADRDKGYDAKAAQWQAKLDALEAAASAEGK
jgi:serine/threonine protein kinase/tetratricopeptide (TPR) repeat protein